MRRILLLASTMALVLVGVAAGAKPATVSISAARPAVVYGGSPGRSRIISPAKV
jgi:hypothetical protein